MTKILFPLSLCMAGLAAAQAPPATSELDYLSDLPIVLSVSRLPQRLDETPGAVTVIDRDMIRLSGARDVADLMRLVPGFQTSSSFESVGPQASYHGAFTRYSNHLQVLVDGRSVYSPYFIGSVEVGLQSVSLDDIERIEVLRGSNSAAYGARAMLGVINIVTRNTADTIGVEVGFGSGQNGLRDSRASIGWRQHSATFRIGVDRRGDDGLAGSNGHNEINRANIRADIQVTSSDEIQLRAGTSEILSGKGGDPIHLTDIRRDQHYGSTYGQLDWRRVVGVDQDFLISYSHGRETNLEGVRVNFFGNDYEFNADGQSTSDAVLFQHMFRLNELGRIVWGAEWRRESVHSFGFYSTEAPLVTNFRRLFGSLEWRVDPKLIVNVGALAEQNSMTGGNLSPRLMLNWHAMEGQTLRAGISTGFRPPSTYENSSNVQIRTNGFFDPIRDSPNTLASGNLRNERLQSRELGYLGNFPHVGLSLDVRVFNERISDLITQIGTTQKDYANTNNFSIRGAEYQLKWKIWDGAQLILNQTYTKNDSINTFQASTAPVLSNSINLFQKLPAGFQLSLMHQDNSAASLPGSNSDHLTAITRTDVRLSAPLRFGNNRGELAFVVQNLGNSYPDFFPHFQFERRAFITLRVEH